MAEIVSHHHEPHDDARPVVLTDVDGVLVDWIGAFHPWLIDRLGYDPNPLMPLTYDARIAEWMGWDVEPTQALIHEFQVSPEAERLPAYPDALEFIPKIHAGGYKFVAITSVGVDPRMVETRVRLLERLFPGMFTAVHLVPAFGCKRAALRLYRCSVWVDDLHHHVVAGRECGHTGLHMARDGSSPCGIPMSDWGDVHAILAPGFRTVQAPPEPVTPAVVAEPGVPVKRRKRS